MKPSVRIESLPDEISLDQAVDAVYGEDLRWVEDKLRRSLSVLIECDKQLVPFLYRALRRALRGERDGRPMRCRLVAGRARPPAESDEPAAAEAETARGILGRSLEDLGEAVRLAEADTVVVVPHLDLLTTTTRSGLSLEAREAIAWFYDNPDLVFLGFADPSFELPRAVEQVFGARRTVLGIPRERLPLVITRREARKLGEEAFDPFRLYKYVSGLNAVRFRRVMEHFHDRLDYDPRQPAAADAIYADIRDMTLISDLEVPRVSFDEIGGYHQVKKRLREEVLDLLEAQTAADSVEEKQRVEELIPRGMIFVGPPGTGKTHFAKAIATAIDGTAIVVNGPELKGKWVGESEANLRSAFTRARRSAPALIVFDELDSFASARGLYGGSGVEHSMVNQLLAEMDGFRSEELVLVVGTTNFPEVLDPALLRPGRFELMVEIPYPDEEARRAILELYLRRFGLADATGASVLDDLVRQTGGWVDQERGTRFSGDHLQALCRALKREELRGRLRDRQAGVTPAAFEVTAEMASRVLGIRLGAELVLSPAEERVIATHEAGHALCAALLSRATAVQKVSLGSSGVDVPGVVLRAVRQRRNVITRGELEDDLAVLLAGRASEELVLGDVSVGAQDDLQEASELARTMVEELGMGVGTGPRSLLRPGVRRAGEMSGGRSGLSDRHRERLDAEIASLLSRGDRRAREVIEGARGALDDLVAALLEAKEVDRAGLDAILARHGLP